MTANDAAAHRAGITASTLMSAIIDDDPSIFFRLGHISPELDGMTDPMAIGLLRHVTVEELAKALRMEAGEIISGIENLMENKGKEG